MAEHLVAGFLAAFAQFPHTSTTPALQALAASIRDEWGLADDAIHAIEYYLMLLHNIYAIDFTAILAALEELEIQEG